MALLANDDVPSVLHGQVSFRGEFGSCKSGYKRLQKSKDSLKDCFEIVNIVPRIGLCSVVVSSSGHAHLFVFYCTNMKNQVIFF